MIEAQKAAQRLLTRRAKLTKEQIKNIETIVGIDLEPAKKILRQASKIEMPEAAS
jgi:hypothetical protein